MLFVFKKFTQIKVECLVLKTERVVFIVHFLLKYGRTENHISNLSITWCKIISLLLIFPIQIF